ncbi:hypothetical protein [Stenotrophomonas sp. TWI819]|uniref:hypothetical protein n=1 Tax=Stenotrophomonas sp. TWI819 TaxID=3136800 RepID=UPI0031C4CF5C
MSNHLHPDARAAGAPDNAATDEGAELATDASRGPLRAFSKAYRKARDWHCSPGRAWIVALRFALTGDSGRFRSHGGWMVSRIYKPR